MTTLSRQPTVINLHLSVHQTRRTTSNFGLTFQYKIVDGASDSYGHYGLELARLADLPEDVILEASRVANHLAQVETQNEEESESSMIAKRRKALLRLQTQLSQAYEYSALPDEDLREYVGRFKSDVIQAFMH
ncbi:MutS protein msh4 [Leucoagaricus gongylophorus]